MFDIGSGELMLIAVVALLLFGGRLPDVARNLGRMVSDFKRGLAEGTKPLREVGTQIEREIAETGSKPDASGSRPTGMGPPGMGRPGGGSV